MNDEQKIAYLNAQIMCANIELYAMMIENYEALKLDKPIVHSGDDIRELKCNLHHNAVLQFFFP